VIDRRWHVASEKAAALSCELLQNKFKVVSVQEYDRRPELVYGSSSPMTHAARSATVPAPSALNGMASETARKFSDPTLDAVQDLLIEFLGSA
jgi:hypothetical protein